MKSEHRHELAENDLSKWLGRVVAKAEPHSNKILLATLVVTVVVVAIVYGMKSATGNRSAGFAELTDCETGDCLETVADKYPDSAVGMWARLRSGEVYLDDGIRTSTTNRSLSNDSLHKAKEAFDKVLDTHDLPLQARERALYGLGTCLESLSDANTQPAIDVYETFLKDKDLENSQYRFLVQNRINALKTSRAQEFYAWFHKQDPKPEDLPNARDPLDFQRSLTPGAPDTGDNGSRLPPPPPAAEPHTPAPTPPEDGTGLPGPSLPGEPPAGAPDATPATPSPDGDKPATPAPDSEGSAAPTGGTQP